MRIAMVMAGNEEGGLEKHVEELVAGLAERGHDVVWIAHPKYADRAHQNARFEPVDLARSRKNPLVLWQLWRVLNRLLPDVIHTHGGKALAMVSTLEPWLRPAMVTTLHGRKKRHKGLTKTDGVIAPSRHLASSIDHCNVHVIHHGIQPPVNTQTADRQPAPTMTDGPLWLAVGRLVEEKAFDTLTVAMAKAPGTLWIAGEGPERRGLERQIARLGLEDRVILLGHRSDVPALMQQCHCLVISSRREGFSYVFAEALFNRCPVISTDVPIPNEVLPPHLICPTDKAAELAGLMKRFKPDPELVDSLAGFAATHLTLDSMVDGTLKVYEKVLGGST